ncbi:MAG TPA: DUF1800 domain-containing protein [Opitutaceae bacterium]|nr:DUF1800 domain-containing protein [Opitutaceae bacterium]
MSSPSNDVVTPPATKLSLSPQEAWQPLPAADWNARSAAHLLRRAGWAARPEDVQRAVAEGLPQTLDRLFPDKPVSLARPKLVADAAEETPDLYKRIQDSPPEEKLILQREARERSRMALEDLTIKWLQLSAHPDHAAFEKWVLFLSDVYVVAFQKVFNAGLIWQHYDILRSSAYGPAPALTKAVLRSPAMIMYLDLQQSQRGAPNENFARELFELFVLGVGNYTEQDIKQAALAFTGYRQRFGEFVFVPRQHDDGAKTVFGHTGNFNGDDVIDLAYQLPAAGRFLPHEMVKWYLSDTPLADDYLEVIGQWWRGQNFALRPLARQFFSSRLFFAPEFRGNFIKSPLQFYLGLMQDLSLNVAPLPRQVLVAMRQMGQVLFDPPNVRGWVGGRYWINSATLGARRALVDQLFAPLNEASLNADEQIELVAARANGIDNFNVTNDRLEATFGKFDAAQLTDRLCDYFLPVTVDAGFRDDVKAFLTGDGSDQHRLARIRSTIMTVLQSPEYQLC